MSAVKKETTAGEVIGAAAKAALKKSAGNPQNAAVLMQEGAKKNPALYKALTEPYLADACWQAVRAAAHTERKKVWTGSEPKPPANPNAVGSKFGAAAQAQVDRVVSLARGNVATLLDFPLPIQGLPRLGEATLAMLKQAADFYKKSAADMSTKAKWLKLIISAMPDDKATVGTVLNDKALRKLQAEAGADA
jgi:hypothetical protein